MNTCNLLCQYKTLDDGAVKRVVRSIGVCREDSTITVLMSYLILNTVLARSSASFGPTVYAVRTQRWRCADVVANARRRTCAFKRVVRSNGVCRLRTQRSRCANVVANTRHRTCAFKRVVRSNGVCRLRTQRSRCADVVANARHRSCAFTRRSVLRCMPFEDSTIALR